MSAYVGPTHEFKGGGVTTPLPIRYTLGLDLGKMSDFSALALVEQRPERVIEDFPNARITPVWNDDAQLGVTWLQRWPLRTAYHTIASKVAGLVGQLVARPRAEVRLLVDGTGVGVAVVEILAKEPAIETLGFETITITAGRAVSKVDGGWHVAKGELIAPAQVALQAGTLDISPHLPDGRVLDAELRNFNVTLTEAATATFSHRDGEHDDLVLAVALAVWGVRHKKVDTTLHVSSYLGQDVRQRQRRGYEGRPYGNDVKPAGRLRIG